MKAVVKNRNTQSKPVIYMLLFYNADNLSQT